MSSDLQSAYKVLETEIQGLQALKALLGESFTASIDAIHAMKEKGQNGRLIVAGIGKSGHVARKIAATMASTGTPAYYVHPGEASHGDLGMVTPQDIVLMLSNSGENQELSDLIHYTRRYNITLIGMTSKAQSTLATHSDLVLLLPRGPEAPEACPNGLAPTTSTTMMIALGDALAVALLERLNLTPEQFYAFHPGGKLGQQLQTVHDLMIPYADMAIISPEGTMQDAIVALTEKNQGCVLVAQGQGEVQGMITDGDLKRHMAADLLSKPVSAVMSTSPKTIAPTQLAAKAVSIMTQTPGAYITSLLVKDEKQGIIGLIRLQDCLQAGLG